MTQLFPFLEPLRRASGFVEMAHEIGTLCRDWGPGSGSSGAVAIYHEPSRVVRKSRTIPRHLTGPSYRALIADMDGSIFPLF